MGTECDLALAHSNFTRIQDTPLLILNVLWHIWQEMQTRSWLGKKWGSCEARRSTTYPCAMLERHYYHRFVLHWSYATKKHNREHTWTWPLVGLKPSSGSSLVTRTATTWPLGFTASALSRSNCVASTATRCHESWPPPGSFPKNRRISAMELPRLDCHCHHIFEVYYQEMKFRLF